MAISQRQIQKMQQTLSPQQIQMIKLLELPTVQLEQRIKQEIEENIVLEEEERTAEEEEPQQISVEEYLREDDTPAYKSHINNYSKDNGPYISRADGHCKSIWSSSLDIAISRNARCD